MHMQGRQGDAYGRKLPGEFKEIPDLPPGEGHILREAAVRGAQMGEQAGYPQGGNGHQRQDFLRAIGRNSQPVHSGVDFQVNVQGQAGFCQLPAVQGVGHRLGQAVFPQVTGQRRGGVPQNQNISGDAALPQADALLQGGHGEIPDARPVQAGGHLQQSVAVGVGLYHRHDRASAGQQFFDGGGICPEGIGMNQRPGPGFFQRAARRERYAFHLHCSFHIIIASRQDPAATVR